MELYYFMSSLSGNFILFSYVYRPRTVESEIWLKCSTCISSIKRNKIRASFHTITRPEHTWNICHWTFSNQQQSIILQELCVYKINWWVVSTFNMSMKWDTFVLKFMLIRQNLKNPLWNKKNWESIHYKMARHYFF